MCGIIGYTGYREAAPILLDGLANLEYRGYDSAGISVIAPDGDVAVRKASGKLESLVMSLQGALPVGSVGIGHTRWATHGEASISNAHPLLDCRDEVIVVHNGIVENYLEIKDELVDEGHTFASETDSEVIPHLIEGFLGRGSTPEEAVRLAALRLTGAHAAVVMCKRDPGKLIAFRVRNAGGILVGYGENEMVLASDLPAIIPHTRKVVFLSAGEMVSLTDASAAYSSLDGSVLEKTPQHLPYDAVSVAKGGYSHFMLKEIVEQPQATIATLRGRVSFDPWDVSLDELELTDADIDSINRVIFVAMGTSFNAALVARQMMEQLSGLPSEAEIASEFRYRSPILDSKTLVVSIGQSGETADTLSAMEEASRKGARLITVCNSEGSQATRLAEGCIYLRAGPEIGVASTKTFTCSLEALYLLAVYIGRRRGFLSGSELANALRDLVKLPDLLSELVSRQEPYIALAERYHRKTNFLYMGRGPNYPIALEGALKLKEIAYTHAEGCSAGEMKHGPIALVDEGMPVVAIAPQDGLRDKMLNSIFEVKARGATVIAVATEGSRQEPYIALAERYHRKTNFLYMGRGPNYPIALEGALKLKEIAYTHAEGCSAGEMKHGPIALVDEGMPVVAIAPQDGLRDKMLNSIFEVKARGATVIAVATEGDEELAGIADHVLYIPPISPLLTPVLSSVPLQLLAYHIAVKRGCEIDQPRNLAKSVTVE